METRLMITTVVCMIGLCGGRCLGGSTLYPIADANTSAPPTFPLHADTRRTNDVPADAGFSVILKPTAIGPAGASGIAQINDHAVAVHVSGLGPGRYDLQLSRRRDDVIQPLGSLTIADPTASPSRQASDNKKEASANPESVQLDADVQIKLPSKLKPRDVARVLLVNSGGNAVLAGGAQGSESRH